MTFGFTDVRTDLGNQLEPRDGAAVRTPQEQQRHLEATLKPVLGDACIVTMNQVHGNDVALAVPHQMATVDALIVNQPGVAAIVRVADCLPIVIADVDKPVAAVVHAGRVGMVAGVVAKACDALGEHGAENLNAWLGPRACGSCYEVPEGMRAEVSHEVPEAFATTRWGTPALDIGAGVKAQLARHGVTTHDLGVGACTIEDERFWSYRRQGAKSGRFGAVVTVQSRKGT